MNKILRAGTVIQMVYPDGTVGCETILRRSVEVKVVSTGKTYGLYRRSNSTEDILVVKKEGRR
jgi:hypothetical protein